MPRPIYGHMKKKQTVWMSEICVIIVYTNNKMDYIVD